MSTDTLLLIVIIILLVVILGIAGLLLIWRWLSGILARLERLEKITEEIPGGEWKIPYKLRSAILDMKAPLVDARISIEAEFAATIARLERTLSLYSDVYNGIYDPDQPGKKRK